MCQHAWRHNNGPRIKILSAKNVGNCNHAWRHTGASTKHPSSYELGKLAVAATHRATEAKFPYIIAIDGKRAAL
jgi:hypothetical protein